MEVGSVIKVKYLYWLYNLDIVWLSKSDLGYRGWLYYKSKISRRCRDRGWLCYKGKIPHYFVWLIKVLKYNLVRDIGVGSIIKVKYPGDVGTGVGSVMKVKYLCYFIWFIKCLKLFFYIFNIFKDWYKYYRLINMYDWNRVARRIDKKV